MEMAKKKTKPSFARWLGRCAWYGITLRWLKHREGREAFGIGLGVLMMTIGGGFYGQLYMIGIGFGVILLIALYEIYISEVRKNNDN